MHQGLGRNAPRRPEVRRAPPMLADWAGKKSRKNSASGSLLPWLVRTICVGRGEMGARRPAASAAGPPSAQGTVAMAKIQSEVIVGVISSLAAVAGLRGVRNTQLSVIPTTLPH